MLDQQTRSDPSRRVVFKATGAKRPSFSQSLSDFDLTVADTFETREAAYRLRHQVYCLERGYEPSRGGRETDDFDQDAGHILLSQRSTGRVVGTVRVVVAEDGAPSGLPLGLICPAELLATLPQGRTGEVSRFAISKELRDVTAGSSMPMRLGLVRGIVQLSAARGLTQWCAVMEPTLLRLLRISGIHFQPLGPVIEHHGLRQPSWGNIAMMLARMHQECPSAWEYVTDGGTLYPDYASVPN